MNQAIGRGDSVILKRIAGSWLMRLVKAAYKIGLRRNVRSYGGLFNRSLRGENGEVQYNKLEKSDENDDTNYFISNRKIIPELIHLNYRCLARRQCG